jgi:hypothetical protein
VPPAPPLQDRQPERYQYNFDHYMCWHCQREMDTDNKFYKPSTTAKPKHTHRLVEEAAAAGGAAAAAGQPATAEGAAAAAAAAVAAGANGVPGQPGAKGGLPLPVVCGVLGWGGHALCGGRAGQIACASGVGVAVTHVSWCVDDL